MTSTLTAPAARPAAVDADAVLRRVLLVDAAITGANGLGYLAAASAIDADLGLSVAALRGVGGFLVLFAGVLVVVATRRPIPRTAGRELVAGNVVWVLASLVAAATLDASGVGTAWIVLQAVVVGGFVGLQRWALSRRG